MPDMPEFFENMWNSPSRYVIILIGAVIVLYIPFMVLYMKRKKKSASDFLAKNPTAAKAFAQQNALMGGQTAIMSVNGESPVFFMEGIKQGFYLLPGENTIVLQYSWMRPGVLHKTVTSTIGPISAKVTAAANKTYQISYDKKEEICVFEETGD
jgi:hypothetical protein